MPRQPRVSAGGQVYHVINRANGRLRLFRKDEDCLYARLRGTQETKALLSDWPIPMRPDCVAHVNRPQTPAEELAVQTSIHRGRPLGDDRWVRSTAVRYGLQATLRERGGQRGPRKDDE